jgi:glutamate-ammonia-ligase adenylyltransferase
MARSSSARAAAKPRIASARLREKLRAVSFSDPTRAAKSLARLLEIPYARRELNSILGQALDLLKNSPDPDRALVNFERFVEAMANPTMFLEYLRAAPERLDMLVNVFSHSHALAEMFISNSHHFPWLIQHDVLHKPKTKSQFATYLARSTLGIRAAERKYDEIRRFRRREMLRIGVRDLLGLATVEQTTRELSHIADVCLQQVYEIARANVEKKLGKCAAQFAIIGMGKLGGEELNYSSDIDVMFVYSEEGNITPQLTHHQFFTKLAEEIVRVVGGVTEERHIFRIDLRLRPEGVTGPLVRSLESYENYYASWGETWERMALIKARAVAGDEQLGGEFEKMVQPFVYRRHVGETVVQQMAALKTRIEKEVVKAGELTRHVKLGIGGIREIEFIVQSLQILYGANPKLHQRSTLAALEALAKTGKMPADDVAALAEAYKFLRTVEHRLQLDMELQTHTIPDEKQALRRLAHGLRFANVDAFQAELARHTANVRRVYENLLTGDAEEQTPTKEELVAGPALEKKLRDAGFHTPENAAKTVEMLREGPGFVHVSQRTRELFTQIFPVILAETHKLGNPDDALEQLEKFVESYGSRGLLYEMFATHPKLITMLLRLFDSSRFLANILMRHPELFDHIAKTTAYVPKNRDALLEQLRAAAATDEHPPHESARIWKRAEILRIGLGDILGEADIEQTQFEITFLAEACLEFALECVRRQLPLENFPFAIIGMGKLGGQELGYGADLDVLFVGGKSAGDVSEASKIAAKIMEFVSKNTASGSLFAVDARLRPDGEKGTLANTLQGYSDYYKNRAQFWEWQALTRARFVAGDAALGKEFMKMVHGLIYAQPLTDGQLAEIKRMRQRIETERVDARAPEWECKTGRGGLVDIEFLVQALQLRHACAHSALRATNTLVALNRLAANDFLDEETAAQLRWNFLFLRKIELTLRRHENLPVSKLPSEERQRAQLAKRLGFDSLEKFVKTYRSVVDKNRELYEQLLG